MIYNFRLFDKVAIVKANLRASAEERLPENELIAQMR